MQVIQGIVRVSNICLRLFIGSKLIIPPAPKPAQRIRAPDPPVPSGDDAPPLSGTSKSAVSNAAAIAAAGAAGGNLPNGTRVRVVRSYAGQLLSKEEMRTGETTSFAHGWYYCVMDDCGQVIGFATSFLNLSVVHLLFSLRIKCLEKICHCARVTHPK